MRMNGLSVFISARFGPTGAKAEADWLRDECENEGATVFPSRDPGNLDRAADIADGIKKCDLFLFLGTATYGESWLRLRLRLLKRPPTPIRPSLNTGEDTGNPMCSYEEFKFAKQLKKPIAWLNMNGGEPPENPVVQMGLQGNIYHMWSQDRATIDWVFEKLAATRSLDTSAIRPPRPSRSARSTPFFCAALARRSRSEKWPSRVAAAAAARPRR